MLFASPLKIQMFTKNLQQESHKDSRDLRKSLNKDFRETAKSQQEPRNKCLQMFSKTFVNKKINKKTFVFLLGFVVFLKILVAILLFS